MDLNERLDRRSRRKRKGVGCALAAVLLVVGGCGGEAGAEGESTGRRSFAPLAAGDLAPEYSATTLAGKVVAIGPDQPVTLLNLWATWCVPCRTEFPDLQEVYEEYADRGFRIVAVSVDAGGPDRVQEFVNEMGATFDIVHDPDARIEELYRTIGLPNTYLLDSEGKMVKSWLGPLPVESAREAIEGALGAG